MAQKREEEHRRKNGKQKAVKHSRRKLHLIRMWWMMVFVVPVGQMTEEVGSAVIIVQHNTILPVLIFGALKVLKMTFGCAQTARNICMTAFYCYFCCSTILNALQSSFFNLSDFRQKCPGYGNITSWSKVNSSLDKE